MYMKKLLVTVNVFFNKDEWINGYTCGAHVYKRAGSLIISQQVIISDNQHDVFTNYSQPLIIHEIYKQLIQRNFSYKKLLLRASL